MDVEQNSKIKFIMLVGKALHRYGASADRIETALYVLSSKLGIKADYFSLPTSIMANFQIGEDEFTRMARLDPGKINLEKLYLVDKTIDDVVERGMEVSTGTAELQRIVDKSVCHGAWSTNFSLLFLASGVSILLGGNLWDCLVSGLLGFFTGIFTAQIKLERFDTVLEAVAGFIVSFLAFGLSSWSDQLHPPLIVLSTMIYFIPGLSLTMAMGEIASQNLTSGTARLLGALVILLKIGFGVYTGSIVAQTYFDFNVATVQGMMIHFKVLALFIVSFSFVISFQARWREAPWIVVAGVTTYALSTLIALFWGQVAATFITGIYIGAAANAYARWAKKPAMIFALPAIILLVPGSIGFKGMEFLFSQDTVSGVNSLFNMTIIGISLVAGSYIGNTIIRPKRSL